MQLKLLKIVLKNLADPVKSQDPKYRQLKLENPKVQSSILPCCPSSIDYLKAIGFQETQDEDTNEKILRIDSTNDFVVLMQASLQEVSNGLDIVNPTQTGNAGYENVSKKHRTDTVEEKKDDTLIATTSRDKLSEKQKARILADKAKQLEREEAKAQRRKVAQLIKQDKYVRENDENWTSAPSAACAKTGNSISTFRDRHGETDN
jgi:PUB domain